MWEDDGAVPFFDVPEHNVNYDDGGNSIISMLKNGDIEMINSKMLDYQKLLPSSLVHVIPPCWEANQHKRQSLPQLQKSWLIRLPDLNEQWTNFIKSPVVPRDPPHKAYFTAVDEWREQQGAGISPLRFV